MFSLNEFTDMIKNADVYDIKLSLRNKDYEKLLEYATIETLKVERLEKEKQELIKKIKRLEQSLLVI